MRLRISVLCGEGCHDSEIESTEIGDGAQELYNRVWDAHDAACRTLCGCSGKVSLIIDYTRSQPYEARRLATHREATA